MSRLAWLAGGGALATYLWSRTSRVQTSRTPSIAPSSVPGRWVWPVASWKGRAPVVSNPYSAGHASAPRHAGVDIMFARLPADSFKAGTPNASKAFVMPDNQLALAASDGIIRSAMKTPRGFAVVIDHGPRKLATFYTHLEKILVAPTSPATSKQRVRAGEPLGVVGFSPTDPEKLKHLHFEMWMGGPADAIDPQQLMTKWDVLPASASTAPRNGASYRAIGGRGEPYPQWVRDLKDRSGVYIIRDRETQEILYVGSSTGRLYDTLTRHFQIWRRWKGFWKGQFAEGHDPGLTYDRGSVEVSVRLTRPDRALDEEARLIQRLRPRDNLLGQPSDVDETVPF